MSSSPNGRHCADFIAYDHPALYRLLPDDTAAYAVTVAEPTPDSSYFTVAGTCV